MLHAIKPASMSPATAMPRDAAPRKRPKPGERREQILQCLAGMLEEPGAERITTAALAQRLQVSEAALYRHFASKAQMFEALIEFIERSMFGMINQIVQAQESGLVQASRIVQALLGFAEKNAGLCRVMAGDALVGEHARLQVRMNQFFERVEAALRQSLKLAVEQGATGAEFDPLQRAQLLAAYVSGCLFLFARTGPGCMSANSVERSLRVLLA
ncbi:MAG: nucleoid occlusion factor SlmA [Betaproteobacteria bacterium]|uniref:Putative Bacterial regulatory protein, TetR n=2 Tax=Burkholderiales genera incertae sedis TaxID=224471 RepID=A0A238D350_THIDL|nr:nucleoid occlusion factor SlmA [Betaproteobacteria bacterium]SBP87683.1 putative Bacterial regulatory protein, TetR [Thiomonas delicata]